MCVLLVSLCFFFQAEDGIRDLVRSRGLGDVYKRQLQVQALQAVFPDKARAWSAPNRQLRLEVLLPQRRRKLAGHRLSLIHI